MYTRIDGQVMPTEVYIARANQHILGRLNCNSAKLQANLLDIWELSIEVDKNITTDRLNPHYGKIQQYMEIWVKGIGWFRINGEPEERMEYTSGRIYKTFTAYGYETQLQDLCLYDFYVNTGEEISQEMYPENLNALGIPNRNIQFYIDDATEDATSSDYYGLGLLNILEHDYLSTKGWHIGYVDLELKSLRGRVFEITSQDVYSFLTQQVMASYKCVITFDRQNKTVNAYQVENLGKSLNIELNRRNVLNSVTVTAQDDYSFTQYKVQGGNEETTIAYWNFGSNVIENLSYFFGVQLKPEISGKYQNYIAYKDTRRQEYADTICEWLKLQEKINVLYDQVPIGECKTAWGAYELDELKDQLKQFEAMQTALENQYTVDGVLKIEGSKDWPTYLSIKEVIIPSIQYTITAKENGTDPDTVNYETNWSLYGIDELEAKRAAYEEQKQLLTTQGYDKPWTSDSSHEQGAHDAQYATYQQISQYLQDISDRIDDLTNQVHNLEKDQKEYEERRDNIVVDVNIRNEQFGFTEEELLDINSLRIETEFTDSTIEFLDSDDIDSRIALSKELYDSACKELERKSRPQLRYQTSIDNLYRISTFSQKMESCSLGDFVYLEIDNDMDSETPVIFRDDILDLSNFDVSYEDGVLTIYDPAITYDKEQEYLIIDTNVHKPKKIKQRIVSMTIELVDLSDPSIDLEFSDMVMFRGDAADYDFLLGNSGSSSSGRATSVSSGVMNIMSGIALDVLNNYLNGTSTVFPNGISVEDQQKLIDVLNGLIDGNLSLEELKVKLAKIENLEADCAFIKYLNTQYLVAQQGDFVNLKAQVAEIDTLLAGTASAELAHVIKLTAENVEIDEAVIKELIASKIMVSDLHASDITLNEHMRILSENGQMIMNGETLQIMGTDADGNEYVAIQLGYDTEHNPSLIICDETGAIMLDAQGLHESIVPDKFIKTDMLGDGSVTEDKIDKTNIHEWTDDEGNKIFDVSQFYYGNDKFEVSYNQLVQDVDDLAASVGSSSSGLALRVDNLEKNIESKVWQSDIDQKISEYDGSTIDVLRDRATTIEQDLEGIKTTISDVQTTVGDNYSELSNKITTVQTNLDEFSVSVSNTYVSNDKLTNYKTSAETETYVTAKIGEFQSTVYDVQIQQYNNDIEDLNNYRTVSEEKFTQILQNTDSITTTVESITSDISNLTNDVENLNNSLEEQISTVITQHASDWRIDFSENGANVGSTTIDKTGITVIGESGTDYTTKITPTEFAGYYGDTKVFYLNQDWVFAERLAVNRGLDLNTLTIVTITQDNYRGIDILTGNAQV